MNKDPLLGHIALLGELFTDAQGLLPRRDVRGSNYPSAPGWYFLGGLPGSINIQTGEALYVRPAANLIALLQARCCNGVLGSFNAVQSSYWHDQGKLPIWAYDSHHIANIFVATVDWSELDRFNAFAQVDQQEVA